MIHGTSDNKQCWCGAWTDDVGGWVDDYYQVECIECLRVKIHDSQKLLHEVACSDVEFENERVRYVVVQIHRETFDAIRALGGEVKP